MLCNNTESMQIPFYVLCYVMPFVVSTGMHIPQRCEVEG